MSDVKKPHLVSLYGLGKAIGIFFGPTAPRTEKPPHQSQSRINPKSGVVEMRKFGRATKFFIAATAALMMFAAAPTPSQAANGTVRLHVVRAGVIIGVGGGDGVLFFHHRRYPLKLSGIGIGTLGISAVDLVGTVSNLRRATDIIGSYSDAGAGITFIGGEQAATLTNDKGVVLQVRGPQTGFQIQLSLGGMNISMR